MIVIKCSLQENTKEGSELWCLIPAKISVACYQSCHCHCQCQCHRDNVLVSVTQV